MNVSAPPLPATALERLPLVSVIVNNFNYEGYVAEAVASALTQDYARIEICVVDDASSDGSWAAIEAIRARSPGAAITAVRHDSNLGQLAAVRSGLAATSGPLVVILDADDVLLPEFVRLHVAAHLNGAMVASVSSSDMAQIDHDGMLICGTKPAVAKHRVVGQPWPGLKTLPLSDDPNAPARGLAGDAAGALHYIDRGVPGWHWPGTSGNMLRRAALELAMPDDCDGVRRSVDCYFLPLLHAMSGTLVVARPLALYRRHSRNGYGRNPVVGSTGETGWRPRSYDAGIRAIALDHLAAHREAFVRVLRAEGCLAALRGPIDGFPELDARLCAILAEAPELIATAEALENLVRDLARRHGRGSVAHLVAALRPAILRIGGRPAWLRYRLKYVLAYRLLRRR